MFPADHPLNTTLPNPLPHRYGDDVPSSVAGKAVAVATMLCGTLVIAFPMVIIGQNFQEAYKNYKRSTREKELRRKPNMLKYLRGKSRAGGDYPGGNSDCGSMMSGQRRAKTGSSIPRPEGGIRITPQASAVPSTTGSLVGGSPLSRAQPTRPKRTASALTQGSQAVSALGGEPFTFEMIPMKRASRVMSQTFPVASNVPSESAIGEAHSRGEDSAKIAEVCDVFHVGCVSQHVKLRRCQHSCVLLRIEYKIS